ncbi:MAG: hypothetical protein ACT4QE_19395 [Anaerolineales bacterium]
MNRTAEIYNRLTQGTCHPQGEALAFDATGDPRALSRYLPITHFLADDRPGFDQLLRELAHHPNFDLRLFGDARADLTAQLPDSARYLVAGHITETFFYRRDILEKFFAAPRHFHLYTTARAYQHDGGNAGGQYHSDREAVQLVLSRLFEGFNGPTPGVAPFLHEFGHMLDFFDLATGTMRRSSDGFLPGLRPSDGAIFSARAREGFIEGKRLELHRYRIRYTRLETLGASPLPIGHPYVFQNDAEFCAGYFEMFFRNPHHMAEQNADLFNAYVELFGYDTRWGWETDFDFYINANREFYLSGQQPWPPGLTIPGI